jgi:hypothetical protein
LYPNVGAPRGKNSDVKQLTSSPDLIYTIKLSEPAALFLEKLDALSDIHILSHQENNLTLNYVGTAENQPNLLKQLMALGIPIIEITQTKHRLQDLYLGKKA